VSRSAGRNFSELQNHQQDLARQAESKMYEQIEEDFYDARGDSGRLTSLGQRLQGLGLFAKYEDRFYALLRECS
jgi:hypothetical protein